MRIAYFDCFAGASGDMILGALLDAGLSLDVLEAQLGLLPLTGWSLSAQQVEKRGLRATKLDVRTDPSVRLLNQSEVAQVIEASGLSPSVKARSAKVFDRLFEAEARVHGSTPQEIHLHELGDLDTLIDVVGAAIGLESLGIDAVYASALPTGRGTIRMAHGLLPLPGPAVAELMRGAPLRRLDVEAELVTPTGAAIITTLAQGYEQHPTMTVIASGYGAGSRDLPFANVLRVMVGETADVDGVRADYVSVLETQIDDMPPEWFGYVMGELLGAGALDVYFAPVQMKKNRPGTLLTIVCRPEDASRFGLLVLTDTTTLGVRRYDVQRLALPRASRTIDTEYGTVQVKVATLPGGKERIAPEYESCLLAAQAHGVPIWEVYQAALRAGYAG